MFLHVFFLDPTSQHGWTSMKKLTQGVPHSWSGCWPPHLPKSARPLGKDGTKVWSFLTKNTTQLGVGRLRISQIILHQWKTLLDRFIWGVRELAQWIDATWRWISCAFCHWVVGIFRRAWHRLGFWMGTPDWPVVLCKEGISTHETQWIMRSRSIQKHETNINDSQKALNPRLS